MHGDVGKAAVLGEVVSDGGTKMCQHRELCLQYERLKLAESNVLPTTEDLGLRASVPRKPSALIPTNLQSSCTSGAHIPATV